ncbi:MULTISPECIES: hypothetical protein [unclassified Streptomyces]|uniref:hypothetical protein n=1 Tax=unclassified Streptomyces TaxID=2593676 RepID=UPI0012FF2FDC|nr:hypothetical protein [Streptomyces sp. PCS3-D2]WKV71959.1 hypothetical protein AW27_010775 [Streptomyces sp. PCS3-D2]
MTTFVNFLVVLALATLLIGPALYLNHRDRRTDRQLRAAATRLVWLPRQRSGGLPPNPRRSGGWHLGPVIH